MLCLPPERVAAPASAPVTLAEAKAHLRVDHDQDDALITAAIDAATGHLDGIGGILGRALIAQQWREHVGFWPASRSIGLALAPVTDILSVVARDADGVETTLDPGAYRLLSGASRPTVLIGLDATLPTLDCAPDAVTITYAAGYGDDPGEVPAALRSAILLMVGDLYRFTDSVAIGSTSAVPMSTTVDRLLSPFRRSLIS
jgi:uncharacterized phiE125 gp8 family phage protein